MTYISVRDFTLEVAKGNIPKHSLITKFGYNDDVDAGSVPEDIWNYGGAYVEPTTARTHNIVSSDVNDTSAGTGARTVLIRGVNGSYAPQTETITLNGTTPVATANTYYHIHLMQVTSSGSGNTNAGIITATAQTDSTVTCSIDAGYGQSASTIYLVPDGYKGYIMRIRARMNNATANSAAEVALYTKPFGMGLQLKTRLGVNNSGSSFIENDYTGSSPFIIPAKCWVRMRTMTVTNNNTQVEAEYDMILVQD